MVTIQSLPNLCIDFVQINCIHEFKNSEKYIDFTVWEKKDNAINISAYRAIIEISKSYDILKKFLYKNIPCNYYIGELFDEQFISSLIKKNTSIVIDTEVSEKIQHLEFKVNPEFTYDIAEKFINNNIELFDKDLNSFFTIDNLILNKHNINLSARFFTLQSGFKMHFLTDLFSNADLKIRANTPVPGIPVKGEWEQKEDNLYYNILKVKCTDQDYYRLFINEHLVAQDLMIYNLSYEYYVMLFGKYFYLKLINNFLQAWQKTIQNENVEYSQQQSQNKTRTNSRKTILVEPAFCIPTIKEFTQLIYRYNLNANYEHLAELVAELNNLYCGYVSDSIRNLILHIKKNMSLNYVNLYVYSTNITKELAIQTVKAACLKATMLASEDFVFCFNDHINYNMSGQWLKSRIFRYILRIKIYT